MAQPLPDYNPGIIEEAAQRLYGKATSALVGSVAFGACLGLAFGSVPLTSLGDAWPIPSSFGLATLLAGGVVGAAIGYVIGDARAFGYRLQAQATLSQLHLERNTAATAHALTLLAHGRAPAVRPAAPAPQQPAPQQAQPQRQAQPQPQQRPAAPPAQAPAAVRPPAAPPAVVAPPASIAPPAPTRE
jgi:hypothetical protein